MFYSLIHALCLASCLEQKEGEEENEEKGNVIVERLKTSEDIFCRI